MSDTPDLRCPRCRDQVLPSNVNATHVKCAFVSGTFDSSNWNCGTMTRLRETADDMRTCWNDDNNACLLPMPDGTHLLLVWYKSRGQTLAAWVAEGALPPRPATVADAEAAIEFA